MLGLLPACCSCADAGPEERYPAPEERESEAPRDLPRSSEPPPFCGAATAAATPTRWTFIRDPNERFSSEIDHNAKATVLIVAEADLDCPCDASEPCRLRTDRVFRACENCTSDYDDEPTVEGRVRRCSGVAVAKDKIATAAHCLSFYESLADLAVIRNVRDMSGELPRSSIGRFAGVIYRHEQWSDGVERRDLSILRVMNRCSNDPPFHSDVPEYKQHPEDGEEVYVIGHPLGLPLMYSGGATANLAGRRHSFDLKDADLAPGSSGSPVFSARDHKLVGFVFDDGTPAWACDGSNVVRDLSGTPTATSIGYALEHFHG